MAKKVNDTSKQNWTPKWEKKQDKPITQRSGGKPYSKKKAPSRKPKRT